VDAQLGAKLQFTDEGLAKRKRGHCRVQNVKLEWQNLKSHLATLKPAECAEQHKRMEVAPALRTLERSDEDDRHDERYRKCFLPDPSHRPISHFVRTDLNVDRVCDLASGMVW